MCDQTKKIIKIVTELKKISTELKKNCDWAKNIVTEKKYCDETKKEKNCDWTKNSNCDSCNIDSSDSSSYSDIF